MTDRQTYRVNIGGLSRDLRLFEVAPGVRIAIFNMLGDTEVVQAAAQALAARIPEGVQTLVTAEAKSITTGKPQTLYLDEKDRALIDGRKVALVDDVISTGSTLQGMRLIVEKAGGQIVATLAVFTEGERAKWKEIIALGHLPVFTDETR